MNKLILTSILSFLPVMSFAAGNVSANYDLDHSSMSLRVDLNHRTLNLLCDSHVSKVFTDLMNVDAAQGSVLRDVIIDGDELTFSYNIKESASTVKKNIHVSLPASCAKWAS